MLMTDGTDIQAGAAGRHVSIGTMYTSKRCMLYRQASSCPKHATGTLSLKPPATWLEGLGISHMKSSCGKACKQEWNERNGQVETVKLQVRTSETGENL